MKGPSPFYHRSPITEPRHFYGRAREFDVLLSRTVGAAKPQCVSVVGNRRIGKSSLFRQLVDHRGPSAVHESEPVAWVYHDLEGSTKLTIDRFFRSLLRRLEKKLAALELGLDTVPKPADGDAEEVFSERVEDLSDDGIRVVLCLDEFDAVTLNENFDADFFGRLRYLTNSFQLAYVTSSFSELTELCHQDEIRQSPFFNVFSTLNLGLLEEDAARDLLRLESTAAGGLLSDAEIAIARELAGRHPFHLQQAGDACWGAEPPGNEWSIRQRFVEEASPHFRFAFEHLPFEAASKLLACARGEIDADETGNGADLLRRRGLVVESDSQLAPFSEGFRDWLSAQPEPTAAPRPGTPGSARESFQRNATKSTTHPGLSTRPTTKAGRLVAGRYKLKDELGRGGFGMVFRAEDELLNREVAIKCIGWMQRSDTESDQLRARFLQEARAGAGITHPNVIGVHDLVDEEGELFCVMEYFPGRSLRSLLDEHGRLPPADVAELGVQVCQGLQAAHELGIVHRDVKPENLLVDEAGRLKILDFGIAFVMSQLRITTDNATPMTPRYTSPEQANGEAVTPAADIFSLGTVLFEMLTGCVLHEGHSISSVLAQVLSARPPRNLPLLDEHDRDLAAAIRGCLGRRAGDRWASCEALAAALRNCSP